MPKPVANALEEACIHPSRLLLVKPTTVVIWMVKVATWAIRRLRISGPCTLSGGRHVGRLSGHGVALEYQRGVSGIYYIVFLSPALPCTEDACVAVESIYSE